MQAVYVTSLVFAVAVIVWSISAAITILSEIFTD